MDKSGNLKEVDKLYLQVCKVLKRYGNKNVLFPTKEEFYLTLKKFNELIEGHKSILTAIGRL